MHFPADSVTVVSCGYQHTGHSDKQPVDAVDIELTVAAFVIEAYP